MKKIRIFTLFLVTLFCTSAAQSTLPGSHNWQNESGSTYHLYPTFYLSDGFPGEPIAEGFSYTFKPYGDTEDIDAVKIHPSENGPFITLEVRNETLQSHFFKEINLLAIPNPTNLEIYHDRDKFYAVEHVSAPIYSNNEDEIVSVLSYSDGREYQSKCNRKTLLQKESVTLTFDQYAGYSAGILITARQSALIAFLNHEVYKHLVDTSIATHQVQKSIHELLGGIVVNARIDGKWNVIDTLWEQGALIPETHLIPVNIPGELDQIKLTMTRGLWRIDQVSLCEIIDRFIPKTIHPIKLSTAKGELRESLLNLNDPDHYIQFHPGSRFMVSFDLPNHTFWTTFLRTRGYYDDYAIREDLIVPNPKMINLLMESPELWLKSLARSYRSAQSEIELIIEKGQQQNQLF